LSHRYLLTQTGLFRQAVLRLQRQLQAAAARDLLSVEDRISRLPPPTTTTIIITDATRSTCPLLFPDSRDASIPFDIVAGSQSNQTQPTH
jgi:hypothetical protein